MQTGSVGAGAGAGAGVAEGMEAVSAPVGAHSYVALLKELCEEYRLPAAEYELVGDTGPPHNRRFTVRASVALHQRLATAPTKKAARQIAAEQLYSYLRENLARVTKDFCEVSEPIMCGVRLWTNSINIRDSSEETDSFRHALHLNHSSHIYFACLCLNPLLYRSPVPSDKGGYDESASVFTTAYLCTLKYSLYLNAFLYELAVA